MRITPYPENIKPNPFPPSPPLTFPMAAPRNTTYELVLHLARGNVPPSEIPQVLSTVFDAQDYKSSLTQLRGDDLKMWVERLDQVARFWMPFVIPAAHHFSDH